MTPRSISSDQHHHHHLHDDAQSIVSIEDYMTSFDGTAARRSLRFVQQGFKEIQEEMACLTVSHACGPCSGIDDTELDVDDHNNTLDEILPQEELRKRRNLWKQKQQDLLSHDDEDFQDEYGLDYEPARPSENTPLLSNV